MTRAARLHKVGAPMVIEEVAMPALGASDVLVKVEACNLVPNLNNILQNWACWFPYLPLPRLPAVFGLDSAGTIAATGDHVRNFKAGDRVYVNPGVVCGSCDACLANRPLDCTDYAFLGYFGFGAQAQGQYDRYPLGGLSEYLTAPEANLVRLPDNVSAIQAARFGYLGTGYGALQSAHLNPASKLVVLGGTGTLGLGTVLLALAIGIGRIYIVARDRELLERVRQLAPERIHAHSLHDGRVSHWIDREVGRTGVDAVVNCLGPGSDHEYITDSLTTIRRGGRFVNVGGTAGPVPIDIFRLMAAGIDIIGSNWFTVAQGQQMAELARTGLLDLNVFEQKIFPLAQVNDALDSLPDRHGGFTNFIVVP